MTSDRSGTRSEGSLGVCVNDEGCLVRRRVHSPFMFLEGAESEDWARAFEQKPELGPTSPGSPMSTPRSDTIMLLDTKKTGISPPRVGPGSLRPVPIVFRQHMISENITA